MIGKLADAAKVVRPGRIFLRRMIETAKKAKQLDHWIRLREEFHSDLAWWISFLEVWNGASFMSTHITAPHPDITFSSDATGSWGCGACLQQHWFLCPGAGQWTTQCIAVKEILSVVVACAIWGPYWQHRQVLALSDNMAVVHVINSQSSKERTILHLLRCLHFICVVCDITLKADHIAGVQNLAAV